MDTKISILLTVCAPEIAARAYEIFLSRGASHGHDLDDWLQAERELASPPFRLENEETTKTRAAKA